jgi:hypothetical protein
MRALILVAGAALAIAACGKDQAAGNTANVDEDLAAQTVPANDTTAIDAATGDDANMAADVNFTVDENLTANDGATSDSAGNNAI